MLPFECDTCIFIKLKGRAPTKELQTDKLLLINIRRMNLDAFWSRARSTVGQNTRRIKQTIKFSRMQGLHGPFEHTGQSYPAYDHCGYEVATDILMHSRQSGKYHASHVQFETIRRLRTSYSSHVRSTPGANVGQMCWVDKMGHYTRLAEDKCGSLWFNRFMVGLKMRMGQTLKQNKAMSNQLLLKLIQKAEGYITEDFRCEETAAWIVFVTYVVISYVVSLRGNEGQMLEIGGLKKHWIGNKRSYVIIVLWGKIKGEDSYREHTIPCINTTKSGINVRYTLERLLKLKETQGLTDGPAISDIKGLLLPTRDLDIRMHELLSEIFEEDRTLFPPSVSEVEDIPDAYKCFRTLRRTSLTRALEEDVDDNDINIVNKWEQKGDKKKKIVAQPMKIHYAQFEILLKPFLRYTYAM